jgi:hypothetical protein
VAARTAASSIGKAIPVDLPGAVGSAGAFAEQLDGGVGQQLVACKCLHIQRIIQRIQPMEVLTANPQRLTRSCDDADVRCLFDNALSDACGFVDHMFAIIEQKQERVTAKMAKDRRSRIAALHRDAHCSRDHRRDERRVLQHAEINEGGPALELRGQPVPDLDHERGLADAGRADDGEQRNVGDAGDQQIEVPFAADQMWQRRRDIGWPADLRLGRLGSGGGMIRQRRFQSKPLHRSYEGITHPYLRGDEARIATVRPFAQQLAQAGHMESQAAVLHDDVRPYAL